jgi:hypothetical protein
LVDGPGVGLWGALEVAGKLKTDLKNVFAKDHKEAGKLVTLWRRSEPPPEQIFFLCFFLWPGGWGGEFPGRPSSRDVSPGPSRGPPEGQQGGQGEREIIMF